MLGKDRKRGKMNERFVVKNTEKRQEGLRIWPIGMLLYILQVLDGCSPLFFGPSCSFLHCNSSDFFPLIVASHLRYWCLII